MPSFALSAVGPDRPGIIASLAERLAAHGVNVTDSQMGILRGCFALTLVVDAPASVDVAALRGELEAAGAALGLEAVALREVHAGAGGLDVATHVLSVYGADHPGIVAAVTAVLAREGANVCDLRTRLVEADSVYVMVVDVAVPGDADALAAALQEVGEREGVDVALHAADADAL